MTERPILFSAPMVRAILFGTKTQTRRILKPQPPDNWSPIVEIYHPTIIDRHGVDQPGPAVFGASDEYHGCKIRWQPGDMLWVREAWAQNPDHPGVQYNSAVCYRADPGHDYDGLKWRPSIHMPRWASRITLLVETITVERLQDISEVDAIAEGAARLVMDDDGKFYESEQRGNHLSLIHISEPTRPY